MRLMYLHDWLSHMLAIKIQKNTTSISGFAIDSRNVQPGDLFFALPGHKVSGEFFLQHAAKSGAVAAIVSQNYQGPNFGMQLIKVEDPKAALRKAGQQQATKYRERIVGITGSLGKTTAKYFAHTLMSSTYKTFASPKSYNSQLTVPLSLLMIDGDEDFILLEMAVSEPGNMRDLVSVVSPEIALITCIAEQHLTHFAEKGMAGIAEEKVQICRQSSIQILPKDSSLFPYLASHCGSGDLYSFSFKDESADFYYLSIQSKEVVIRTPEDIIHLPVSLPYMPAYYNLLASVALGWVLKVPSEAFIKASGILHLPPMRFECSDHNGIFVINDAYNACPEAMLSAFQALPKPSKGGKTVLVLGQMVDLGCKSECGHLLVAQRALNCADSIFFIGERWNVVQPLCAESACKTFFYPSKEEAYHDLSQHVQEGDVLLMKGSRSVALESLIECF